MKQFNLKLKSSVFLNTLLYVPGILHLLVLLSITFNNNNNNIEKNKKNKKKKERE